MRKDHIAGRFLIATPRYRFGRVELIYSFACWRFCCYGVVAFDSTGVYRGCCISQRVCWIQPESETNSIAAQDM